MKNKGFTLVEVLIVIVVLSIIAVLTLPAIMSNMEKNQVGPALTKAIATLETAHALMMNEHEMDNISDGCHMGYHGSQYGGNSESTSTENYRTYCFEPYIAKMISATKDTNSTTYQNYNATGVAYNMDSSVNKYTTKGGVTYFMTSSIESGNHALYPVLVDINGMNKKPNIYGKDLFRVLVELDESGGSVVPSGGKYNAELMGGTYSPESSWEHYCNITTPIENVNAAYCSASIIENGGKVIYPWR